MGVITAVWVLALIHLFAVTQTTYPEEFDYLNKSEQELRNVIEHLQYLANKHAKPKDRAYLIEKGILESAEHYPGPVNHKDSSINISFDCKIRKLAFEFAKKIASRGLRNIFDGLQLQSLCNTTFDRTLIPYKDESNYIRFQDNDVLEVFVDQYRGKSEYDGSFERPLANIQSGIDFCTTIRSSNKLCQISIRAGVYQIKTPLLIKDNNVKLHPYQGEVVSITSDVKIKPNWKLFKRSLEIFSGLNPLFEGIKPGQSTKSIIFGGKVDNAAVCEKMCDSQQRCTSFSYFDKSTAQYSHHCYMRIDGRWNTLKTSGVISGKKVLIYSADLSAYNLKDVNSIFINGNRGIRARFPNANPETMGLHTSPTGYVKNAVKWLLPHKVSPATEVLIDQPNRSPSLFSTFGIGVGGPVYQFEPPQSYWGTKNPVGGAGATYKVPSGLEYSKDLEINLRSWTNPSTGVIHALQHYHWGNWMFKLDSRNDTNNTLHWKYGGFQEARGASDGKEWYVENILEELDSANEWFYDDDKKVLFYSPNITKDDLPEQISIPQLDSLLQIIGAQSRPIQDTTIKGLNFQHTTKTFLKAYTVPSGGDWTVHKNATIYVEGTENTVIDSCTFDSPEGNGILVINYNRGTMITNNLLYSLGDNGIVLLGDSHLIDGTQGDHPRGVKVMYNTIFDNGIWGKQTYAFVQSRSCESYLKGNVFFNGPRAGVNFNDGFGGGNTINNNLLFNFVRETDDHGPINTWDRVPYLTTYYDGKQVSLKVKENQIHYNFIINNYRSVWPIDHDDGTCFWNDTHNYLVYGGFKNYLGHDKLSLHNIYVYPDRGNFEVGDRGGFCVDTRAQSLGKSGYGDIYQKNTCIIGKIDLYLLGNCKPAFIRELIPSLLENHYYTPKAGFIAKCGSEKWNLEQFRMHGMELDTIVDDLVPDDQVIQWGRDLFKI